MARELRTPSEFREDAKLAEDIAKKIREAADLIEKAGMEGIWTHSKSPVNTFFPKIWEWVNKLKSEYESDHRAFIQDRMPKSEYDKKRNQPKTLPQNPPDNKPTKKKKPPKK